MVYKPPVGHWEVDAAGVGHFILDKKKGKTTRIDLDAACDVDEISDPDCLAESGGHVDEDGNFIEDEL